MKRKVTRSSLIYWVYALVRKNWDDASIGRSRLRHVYDVNKGSLDIQEGVGIEDFSRLLESSGYVKSGDARSYTKTIGDRLCYISLSTGMYGRGLYLYVDTYAARPTPKAENEDY